MKIVIPLERKKKGQPKYMLRGGGWDINEYYTEASIRISTWSVHRINYVGVRIVKKA